MKERHNEGGEGDRRSKFPESVAKTAFGRSVALLYLPEPDGLLLGELRSWSAKGMVGEEFPKIWGVGF